MQINTPTQLPSGYQPVLPLQPTWTSVMSQDVMTTDTIPVDQQSNTPVAPFINRAAGGTQGSKLAGRSPRHSDTR